MYRFFTRYVSRIFITSVFTLLIFSAKAQHYNFASSTATFTAVSGTAVDAIEADDAISATIPIGFTFNYFGSNFTDLKASSNGFLTFNLAGSSENSNDFNGTQSKLIAPLWDDLGGGGGTATYSTTGTAGSRIFTFEWINWKWNYNAAAANISFQVKLYETSNVVQFIYRQEAGTVNAAGASIGLVGDAVTKFYSLDNTSASPVFSLTGNDLLNTRPATNQVYTFTPGTSPTAPATPASQVIASANTGTSINLSWTNGNGTYRAVFMKNTNTTEDVVVADGAFVSASSTFGTGSALYASDWYCVYNGNGNTVSVNGLEPGLSYQIKVVEYNGLAGTQKYVNTPAANNPLSLTATLARPTGNSNPSIYRVSGTEVLLDVSEGSAIRRAVFIKATSNALETPPVVDNTTYTASTTFGLGSQIGNTGWYCVFNGKSTSGFTVTGLTGNVDYVVRAMDYNGPSGSELYTTTVSGNVKTFKTYPVVAVPTYTFAASSGTFTPLVGGTAVADANGGDFTDDDQFSAAIPFGFTFKLAGIPFTQVYASSNGFLTFNAFLKSYDAFNDLQNSDSRPSIAPFWNDISGEYGTATYSTTGAAPNRVFTIEYLNWASDYNAVAAGLSFQVKLYETTNKVEFIYRKDAGAIVNTSASIGLSFANKGTGNFISLNGAGASPTASTSAETTSISTAPATGQIYSFTPVKMNQTITFPTIADRFFGNGTFTLAATSTSGLPISYSSSNTNVATIAGNVVTLTGVGSVTITASQAGDDVFNVAADVPRAFIVNKGSQGINFSSLNTRFFGSAPFELTATSSSSLPVTYTSSNPLVATVSGSTVTITGVGTTDITASQPGNANYNAANNQVQAFMVVKGNQTITLPLYDKKFGDVPFTIDGTSSTGLPLTYASSNPAVATVSGNTVTIVGAGNTSIIATQAGNENWNSVTANRSIPVAKANQTITFTVITDKTVGDAPFTLVATASSGLPVTFATDNNSIPSELEISGNIATVKAGGSTSVRAIQAGNDNYNYKDAVQTFCVHPAKPVVKVINLDTEIPQLEGPSNGNFFYRWMKDGEEVGTSNIFNVTEPGVYTLVTHYEQCESVPSDEVSIVITGTEETTDSGLKIYPNPVMNELIVDLTSLNEKAPVLVELHDASGRTVHSELANKKAIVKMEKQKPGLYLLRVKGSKKVITKQIIKK